MSTDGNKISSYVTDATSKLRSGGRKAVYAIIVTAWTISFTNGMFTPTNAILWSLGLAIAYLFLDLLYYLILSSRYELLLFKYFKPINDGDFQYKDANDGERIAKITKFWTRVGMVWLFFMSILLLVSFAFMVYVVISLKTK